MKLYQRKKRWKIFLVTIAVLMSGATVIYTSWLAGKMEDKEKRLATIWAGATKSLLQPQGERPENIFFILEIIENNTDIPMILTDESLNIISSNNINYSEKNREQKLQGELQKMIKEHPPIRIVVSADDIQFLHYRDSLTLRHLKLLPVGQIGIVAIFIIVAYLAFNSSRKAEQNRVWLGLSKETAHQLGTPISSLMAWVELLKMKDVDPALVAELEKDINRLGKITERFSKIGSAPSLAVSDVKPVVISTVSYLQMRTSPQITFLLDFDKDKTYAAPHNALLLGWVIENLCKNGIDAIAGEGTITITMTDGDSFLIIDVADNGKGISRPESKAVFQPGFTTKAKGWGLGLSLAKRIIENYHKGKIFLKNTEQDKGSVFRIVLYKG